jgi:DNA polymerase
MFQSGLFDDVEQPQNGLVSIRFQPNWEGFRFAARAALGRNLKPEQVWWVEDPDAELAAPPSSNRFTVPREYLGLAKFVACHRAPDRWSLLYEIIWRLNHQEPYLLSLSGDPAVSRLRAYDKSVHRDYHKMKAFVRFKRLQDSQEEQYVAWFEPEHYIVELAAEFFVKRFTNMKWSVLTPVGCAHWQGSGKPTFTPGLKDAYKPEDELDDLWRTYYQHIFNPARVKLDAMRAEMPQKYWKHLPEAELIPSLVLGADNRVDTMLISEPIAGDLHCGERPANYDSHLSQIIASNSATPLERIAAGLKQCEQCELCYHATQAVPGEGPASARIMLVGEQPGDEEDLQGRPFIGPAGQVLNQALEAVGLERSELYLTNAVKHFRFKPTRKKRIHERPKEGHIHACRSWLQREIGEIQPDVIVCLGVTAASSLFDHKVSLKDLSGQVYQLGQSKLVATLHPAAVLRSANPDQSFQKLAKDLILVRSLAG